MFRDRTSGFVQPRPSRTDSAAVHNNVQIKICYARYAGQLKSMCRCYKAQTQLLQELNDLSELMELTRLFS